MPLWSTVKAFSAAFMHSNSSLFPDSSPEKLELGIRKYKSGQLVNRFSLVYD